jgi:hypothetical protein
MKTLNTGLVVSALGVTAVILGGPAQADDFPQTTAAAHFSVTHGFRYSSVPLLQRTVAAGSSAVSASLTAKLCAARCAATSTKSSENALRVSGDHWLLEVRSDGSSAEFQDLEVAGRAHSLAKPPSQKTSAPALEQAGRAFIASKLASVIVLGPEEELVPVRTDYRTEGGQDVLTGAVASTVVANRIVFGRTLRGVPVVGGGSRVVVTFANDGSVESFQYDWPTYQTSDARAILSTGQILRRVQEVIAARTGAPAPAFQAVVPADTAASYSVALTSDTTLQKLECGYYDPGVAARVAGVPVQPGCVYHAVAQGQNGARQGYGGAVPAGAQIEPDAKWAEAQRAHFRASC